MIKQPILVPVRNEAPGDDSALQERRLEVQRRIEQHNREQALLRWALLFLFALAMVAAVPVLAGEAAATVTVSESEEYGQCLADENGRAPYLFT